MEGGQSVLFNVKHLEKATMFVNTNNNLIEDGVTQDEVLNFIVEQWAGEEYITPLRYKGIVLHPELTGTEECSAIIVHISVLPDFTSEPEDFMSLTIEKK